MKNIILFDTSIGTMNQGDNIIMQSIMRQTEEIREGNFVIHFPTHTPSFTAYQQSKHNSRYNFVKNADIKLICGTNIITKRMLFPWTFWNVNLFNCGCYSGAVGVGVGSGGFGDIEKIGRGYTRTLYKKIFHNQYMHSTRDEHTKKLLESIGLKAINTGCPTMWGLTAEHCQQIPMEKSDHVVFTLTDGFIDRVADQRLIDLLQRHYQNIFFWPQGLWDTKYYRSLSNTENIHVLSPDIYCYSELLSEVHNLDYVGTRLHAGIFAMQHKKRTLILSVDNRASDIAQTYGIHVYDRADLSALECAILSKIETKVNIKQKNIVAWKNQFLN